MSTSHDLIGQHLKVLLVEDNTSDALLLERHFSKAGYRPEIMRVETEAEMLRSLEESGESWDVILADYHLPAFSAPGALRVLKKAGYDIPFIVLSGAVSEETAVDAMRAGAHDYISKQNLARLIPALEREMAEARGRRHKREAERALQKSEQRFHRLVESMPLGLIISDYSGRILYANEAIERLLGYTMEELAKGIITLERMLSEEENSEFSLVRRPFWLNGLPEPMEVSLLRKDESPVPVLVGGAILNPEAPETERQLAAFLADLSEQKKSHDVLRRTEKLAAAGRLAASIAHEINNPLEAVTNCLYLLSKGALDDLSQQYLALAQRELDRVVHITTQTLRFYRQNTRPSRTDIHDLLETVLALHEGRTRAFNVEIVRDYGELPAILAYDGEIRQVLANLVGNALDAMQTTGGKLVLRTNRTCHWKTGRRGISITVSDSGIGMDRATLSHIYEPFFSTKGTTGTGLGLWVSREIMEKHQGIVHVRSSQGKPSGTTFRIFLPIEPEIITHISQKNLRVSA
jgi:PAS domain S-box-containing protein